MVNEHSVVLLRWVVVEMNRRNIRPVVWTVWCAQRAMMGRGVRNANSKAYRSKNVPVSQT